MSLFCGSVKIIDNVEIAPGIFRMGLECPEAAESASPGQFLQIRCFEGLAPLLRRPISIAAADKDSGMIEIIYRVVGEGTGILARKTKKDMLDIMGPLGKGFPVPRGLRRPVIVGGGIGVAPLLFLAKSLKENSSRDSYGRESDFCGLAFVGFSSGEEVFGMQFLEDCCFNVEICTDDGSEGHKGFPTDLLEEYLKHIMPIPASNRENAKSAGDSECTSASSAILPEAVYACGPEPLLKKVKQIASMTKIPTYISVEQRMACGVGACLGCAVKSSGGGYLRACRDGPVFEAHQLIL
ncbi:MAG: dihydroorotate dehydrogenase electron transfer subunit [Tepidanaerobacteraceae bacterium]|jgi:dihydroorotate dehydrogenase electron transfer subunit|nr:dihydroorotate dehydrogenase electron transfer subunit [Tepidanaerobacteraceae bacterium]